MSFSLSMLCVFAINAGARSKQMMLREKGIYASYWEAAGTSTTYIAALNRKEIK